MKKSSLALIVCLSLFFAGCAQFSRFGAWLGTPTGQQTVSLAEQIALEAFRQWLATQGQPSLRARWTKDEAQAYAIQRVVNEAHIPLSEAVKVVDKVFATAK